MHIKARRPCQITCGASFEPHTLAPTKGKASQFLDFSMNSGWSLKVRRPNRGREDGLSVIWHIAVAEGWELGSGGEQKLPSERKQKRRLLAPPLTYSYFFFSLNPVPTGISFPMITFSFNPRSLSSLPSKEALINTREVCWKEAADKKDSEAKATSEIPNNT